MTNPPLTVAELIAALQQFPPDALIGTPDYLTGDAMYLASPEVDRAGVVVVGTGGRYTGLIGNHYCGTDCGPYCDL